MKFLIHQNFKIIVFPNKLNKLVEEPTSFVYNDDETVTPKSGLKYTIIKDVYNGDLVPDVEYQIVATLPIFSKQKNGSGNYEYAGTSIVDIKEFSELEGDNPIEFAFLTVED